MAFESEFELLIGDAGSAYVKSVSQSTLGRITPIKMVVESEAPVTVTLQMGNYVYALFCEGQTLDNGSFAGWVSQYSTAVRDGTTINLSLMPSGGWSYKTRKLLANVYSGSAVLATETPPVNQFDPRVITFGASSTFRYELMNINSIWYEVYNSSSGFRHGFRERSVVNGDALSFVPDGGWSFEPSMIHLVGEELSGA